MQTINIGGVTLEKTAALAPMASVADKAYRLMCKKYGALQCVECGCCGYVCPAKSPVLDRIRKAKKEIIKAGSKEHGVKGE